MKRLALVLTVAALAAVSCTTPGAVPVTTTSSSTTQAGASAREAFVPLDFYGEGLDRSQYPSGALLQVGAVPAAEDGDCLILVSDPVASSSEAGFLGPLASYVELPGSRACAPSGGSIKFTTPAPLPESPQVLYLAYVRQPRPNNFDINGADIPGGVCLGYGSARIRW